MPVGEVHVVTAAIDAVPDGALGLLSEDERARAGRYRVEGARVRFVAARALLRRLLAGYLGGEPAGLAFTYGPHGKPDLAGAGDLRFNLSHSGALAVCAVARGVELGVDVEQVRPLAYDRVALRFFSRRETEALLALPPAQRAAGFFNAWTRKEALLKARGGGLTIALSGFTVSLAPGEPAALLEADWPAEDASRWRLFGLTMPEGYAGALAASGPVAVRRFEAAPGELG